LAFRNAWEKDELPLLHQLDLFGEDEDRQRRLEAAYEALLNPPPAFVRLMELMEAKNKQAARNAAARRRRATKRKIGKHPSSPK
jgi:hypothetical protein